MDLAQPGTSSSMPIRSDVKRPDKAKSERRVRFADTMGMELVSIFLLAQMSKYYFPSFHSHMNHHFHKSIANAPASNPNSHNTNTSSHNQSSNKPTNSTTNGTTNLRNTSHNNNNYNNKSSNYHYNHSTTTSHSNTATATSASSTTTSRNNYSTSTTLTNNRNIHSYHSTQQQHQQQQPQKHQPLNVTTASLAPMYRCEFVQPISLISFKERVRLNKVHLETCSVHSGNGNVSVSCTIRVLNQSYDKSVIVRYTTDEWHTFTEVAASYKPGSCDGWSDKFTATFSCGQQLKQIQSGQRITFAIRLTYDGDKMHWDNNGGLNYTVKKV